MNVEMFVLSCQEAINGEFDLLRCGDRFVETDHGKLRIVYCNYATDNISSVEYLAFGVEAKFYPHKDHQGLVNYAKVLEQLKLLIASRWIERHQEIDAIEMYVRELEKIRKAPVTYIRRFGIRPLVEVVLDGTENMVLFTINGTGIKYLPSRVAMGDQTRSGKHVVVRSVEEIKAVPISGYEKIMERRCGSRLMDLFVSENVLYLPPETEDSNFGHIQVGNEVCDIMRIEPIVMGNKIVEFLRGCTVLDGLEVTVAFFDFERRKTDPCKGHVQSAEFRLSSTTNSDFAIWFRLLDNAGLTLTRGLDDTSELAAKLITGYLDPIQLGLSN